jgi:hypothetical protein
MEGGVVIIQRFGVVNATEVAVKAKYALECVFWWASFTRGESCDTLSRSPATNTLHRRLAALLVPPTRNNKNFLNSHNCDKDTPQADRITD